MDLTLGASTVVVAVVSALVPVVNLEVFLAGVGAATGGVGLWLLAALAAIGQMIGKMVFFVAGREALEWGWLRRKTSSPKFRARLAAYRARVHGRPLVADAFVLLSAALGIPPFAIVAVLAGQLGVAWPRFLVAGLVGRFARFAAVLGAGEALARMIT